MSFDFFPKKNYYHFELVNIDYIVNWLFSWPLKRIEKIENKYKQLQPPHSTNEVPNI